MGDNEKKYQACAPATQFFGAEAFEASDKTTIRWLGNAGEFINCHGNYIMIDPLLKGFDMPLLIDMPILPEDVPHLDAVMITHCDNDHYSRVTCREMAPNMAEFNGDPKQFAKLIINPERIHSLAPGEPFILQHLIN